MGRSNGQPAGTLRTYLITRGAYGCVWLSDEAKEEYDALCARNDETSIREATTIRRYFERFAALGPAGLDNPKMMKPEGRRPNGTGRQVQVFAIKAYQWRLYGVRCHHRGEPSFVGLCVDPSKKQNKANPKLIDKCARLSSKL
jgi:hypothetical protein